MRFALLSALLLCGACSNSKPPPEGEGPDASVPRDAGTDDGGSTKVDGGPDNPDAGCVATSLVQPTSVAQGLNTPRRLAQDATDLYISETHSLNPTKSDGVVLRASKAGGAPTVFAQGFSVPDALAVDATYVYVLDAMGLWRVHKASAQKGDLPIDARLGTTIGATLGGTDLLLTTLQGREVIVVATTSRLLVRLDRDGQTRQVLFDGGAGSQVRGARLVGTDVWFLVAAGTNPNAEQGLYRVPLDGSAAATRVDDNIVAGTSLEVSPVGLTPTHLLITEGGGGSGTLKRWALSGGKTEVLASGLQGPMFPVEVEGSLYFKESSAGTPDFLRRVHACAPGGSEPVGPSGTGPGGLLVDGSRLYFTSQEAGTGGAVGRVP
ncbi:hypothetical protein DRW03_28395 [Corallococcus sp. H22C18031201]|uniref:signal integration modulator SinM n=1 Tax=Citreicoccus inhibens TaxID=2849499 RepID=UPI000E708CE5|nr:signal integration modulator SinM [Citreicoccus inhibens]MBU8897869.1 signal integration modulator SinM [Citreicoccus inhibens]RJS16994.1 hypothetical protein DRW03_28395 [Corallococcus sp. H22C18031201]